MQLSPPSSSKGKDKAPHRRERVPKTLHNEITEYTSLLRALKARDLLDLTTQLTLPHISRRAEWDATSVSPSPAPSTSTSSSSSSSRDQWTRWPLLISDVVVPEWSLADEVDVMYKSILRTQRTENMKRKAESQSEQPIVGSNSDVHADPVPDPDFESEISPKALVLAVCADRLLKYMLAWIAHMTPRRAPSMQGRLEVLDWRFILTILADGIRDPAIDDLLNGEILERSAERLGEVYDSPNFDFTVNIPDFLKSKTTWPQTLSAKIKRSNLNKHIGALMPDFPEDLRELERIRKEKLKNMPLETRSSTRASRLKRSRHASTSTSSSADAPESEPDEEEYMPTLKSLKRKRVGPSLPASIASSVTSSSRSRSRTRSVTRERSSSPAPI
ncbi:hypothetical protein FA15DRAFT_673312 [Coprinopsis marcescibilis]|uniref:Uncharacterized protein n=1 Tax=Coprinopsis marcescibilis TaxID=230819 RepID=A0A5C3KKC7_COPMA|nr:hypothetical protein FA15DRAFT_673312 [Coprinopsis marcescibilis]